MCEFSWSILAILCCISFGNHIGHHRQLATGMTTLSAAMSSPTLTLDSLDYIDIATLTQSELLALSRCSSSASNLRRADDVIVPSIDRSTFNESAGSRRQTFCRPGSSTPSSSVHHRSRVAVAGRLSSSTSHTVSESGVGVSDDPHLSENRSIIAYLKQSLRNLPEFYDIDYDYAPPISLADYSLSLGGGGEMKRKRGRKPKPKTEDVKLKKDSVALAEGGRENGLEIVNKNGIKVDLAALADMEDPYGAELRKGTEGMRSEEELLGFLRDLGGEWCSRRRRRKIVDAGVLGDVLPVGWKLLLGLKRKEGRAWVYCRRYISPGGRHFISCKEVSMYLQSYFEEHDVPSTVNQDRNNSVPNTINQDRNNSQQDGHGSVLQSPMGPTHKLDAEMEQNEHPKLTPPRTDNLAEVETQDLFECRKCNMTFYKKEEYLQHLLSLHQRSTRSGLGSSVGDGVIVRDGKFECQFCHKIFDERRRCNSHVGIHVRNYVRGIKETPSQVTLKQRADSTTRDVSDKGISRMDALVEIAQNSMLETSSAPSAEPPDDIVLDELNSVSDEVPASGSENEPTSNFSLDGVETEDVITLRNLDQELQSEKIENTITNEKMEKIDDSMDVVDDRVGTCLDTTIAICGNERNHSESETLNRKYELAFTANRSGEFILGQESTILGNNQESFDLLNAAFEPSDGERKIDCTGVVRKVSGQGDDVLAAPVHQTKGEDGSYTIDQNDGSVARYGELQLDEMEGINLNFEARQESHTVQFLQMDVVNNIGMQEAAYGSSVQYQTQELMLAMGGGSQLTTVCVWCGIEFSHPGLDSEIQSDSVGYMCLSCKSRISGQIGTPDGCSTINSHLF